jgi:hypothetical protein
MFFLVKDKDVPKETLIEVIAVTQKMLANHIQFSEHWTREELIEIAESTLEEYDCTLVPYTAFVIEY